MKLSRLFPIALIVLTLASTSCVGYITTAPELGVVWVASGPPEPLHDIIVESPGPDFIWIQGCYVWTGTKYFWTPGRWERRPFPHAVYVQGRWQHNPAHGWYYVKGSWKK